VQTCSPIAYLLLYRCTACAQNELTLRDSSMAPSGVPGISAKEVEKIALFARRRGWKRLDQGPFFLAYIALVGLWLYQALTQEW
jgi:hypothetical protein